MTNNLVVMLLAAMTVVATTVRITESGYFLGGDQKKLEKLNDSSLSIAKAGKILNSIIDQRKKICGLEVRQIVQELSSTGSSVQDCREDALVRRQKYVMVLLPVTSVYNYANDHYIRLLEFCRNKFPLVIEGYSQLRKLGERIRTNDEVKEIFYSIVDKTNVIVGKISVKSIIDRASSNSLSMKHCRRDEILQYRNIISDTDLNFVLNLYNFLFDNQPEFKSSCAENIRSVFEDNRLLENLNDSSPTTSEVGEMLNSIKDKDNVKFGEFSVKSILCQVKKLGSSVEDYQPAAIERWSEMLNSLKSVESVYKFGKAHYKQLKLFAHQNIGLVIDGTIASLTNEKRKTFRTISESERGVLSGTEIGRRGLWREISSLCSYLDRSIQFMIGSCNLPLPSTNNCLSVLREKGWYGIKDTCNVFSNI